MSFVREDGLKSDGAPVSAPESSRLTVTPQEKRYYNAVCSLASSINVLGKTCFFLLDYQIILLAMCEVEPSRKLFSVDAFFCHRFEFFFPDQQ